MRFSASDIEEIREEVKEVASANIDYKDFEGDWLLRSVGGEEEGRK
jgi:hypothetical protein